ncbi:MAG: SMP-30/gluconolactonase/LRE family protein [Streptomycetaceae bacterium]|nr:MAG: SMP-30/gluconolactonase/LRE family protein [Streptomycetaceae bacterium]
MSIRTISDAVSDLGEGPIWNSETNTVIWVDIGKELVHKADFDSGQTDTFSFTTPICAIAESTAGGFIAATGDGFAKISANGELTPIHTFLDATMRFNDGKVDASGRLWAGSTALDFSPNRGSLYVLETDGSYRKVLGNLTLSNGMAWSPDNQFFYLIDSIPGVMKRFAFNLDAGTLSDEFNFLTFEPACGIPDGLNITHDGFLVVAFWDGSHLEVFSPEGKKIEEIQLPVKRPTSCTFAGVDGETLVVTSAGQGLDPSDLRLDGKVLAIDGTGLSGLPSHKFG